MTTMMITILCPVAAASSLSEICIYERESREHDKDDDYDDEDDDCDDSYHRSILCNPLHYQYCLMRDDNDQDHDYDEKDDDCEARRRG